MTSDPQALSHFLYRSLARSDVKDRDFADILSVARDRNARLNLTGALHFEEGFFFQWLEGPAGPLAEVGASLRRDPRHSDIVTLSEGPSHSRRFAGWAMSDTRRAGGSLMDWLAEHDSPRQDAVGYARSLVAFLQKCSGAQRP